MHPERRRFVLTVAAAWLLCALPVAPAAAQGGASVEGATTILLVRHAETAPDGTRNPPLSAVGRDRAARLARVVGDAGLDAVYTTDYTRTRATAAPVAEALGSHPLEYDPRDLDAVADLLRSHGGRLLVVGHSNTTPALVEALGGDAGPPIEHDEFDRLYVVTVGPGGTDTVRLRY